MAQIVNVNFRLDEDVKKGMEQVCAELGMSMTTAFFCPSSFKVLKISTNF